MTTTSLSLRAAWHQDDVSDFILAVATAAEDEETAMRSKTAEYTHRRVSADQQTTGWPTLAQLIGDKVVDKACDWLGIQGSPKSSGSKEGIGTEEPEPNWGPLKELPSGKPPVPTCPSWVGRVGRSGKPE